MQYDGSHELFDRPQTPSVRKLSKSARARARKRERKGDAAGDARILAKPGWKGEVTTPICQVC